MKKRNTSKTVSSNAAQSSEWINREFIDKKLESIRKRIGQDDIALIHKELDEVFKYKPIDGHYLLARGEAFLEENKYDEIWETLLGKIDWWTHDRWNFLLSEFVRQVYLKCDNDIKAKQAGVRSYHIYNDLQRAFREGFHKDKTGETFNCSKNIYEDALYEKKQRIEQLLNSQIDKDNKFFQQKLAEFFSATMILGENVQSVIVLSVADKMGIELYGYTLTKYIQQTKTEELNIGYLIQQGLKEKNDSVLLIQDNQYDIHELILLAKFLQYIGKDVVIIGTPLNIEIDEEINLSETINISLDNIETVQEITLIHPIELKMKEQIIGENTFILLDQLIQSPEGCYVDVIATQGTLSKFKDNEIFRKKAENLNLYKSVQFHDRLCFGYFGDYTEYISRIYEYNYAESLSKESEYKISIVIPARNSSSTLRYTLMTCLNQRDMSDNEYEIIVSDNSDEGHNEIKQLVEELNDKRIKYYKTPTSLTLSKSFEFAYGLAKGEYILSIGSDDAVLPWGLRVLWETAKQSGYENVITWGRGFFQWSESNSVQAGKFVVPGYYKKGCYNAAHISGVSTLKEQLQSNGTNLYGAPLLYINSSFKRSYLRELLDKTGKIIEGHSHDVHMGVLSWIMNQSYIFIDCPLTIAGMSDASIGAQMTENSNSQKGLNKSLDYELKTVGKGIYPFNYGFKVKPLSSTEGVFFSKIFNLLEYKELKGKIEQQIKECDLRASFSLMANQINIGNLAFMYQLNTLRMNAFEINDELGAWVDEQLYIPAISLVKKEELEKNINYKYEQGFIGGGLILDARKFGVKNISEAVTLFENITNL